MPISIGQKMVFYLLALVAGGWLGYKVGTGLVADEELEPVEMSNGDGAEPIDVGDEKPVDTQPSKPPTDYAQISRNFSNKPPLDELVSKYSTESPAPAKNPIRVVTAEEYGEWTGNTATVTFYEGDNTFADDQDNILPAPKTLFGNEAYKFGSLNADPDVVYIRNDKNGYVYEILRVKASYKNLVTPEEPEVVEPPEKKKVTPRRSGRPVTRKAPIKDDSDDEE